MEAFYEARRAGDPPSWLFPNPQIKFPACKPPNVVRPSASESSWISTAAENLWNC